SSHQRDWLQSRNVRRGTALKLLVRHLLNAPRCGPASFAEALAKPTASGTQRVAFASPRRLPRDRPARRRRAFPGWCWAGSGGGRRGRGWSLQGRQRAHIGNERVEVAFRHVAVKELTLHRKLEATAVARHTLGEGTLDLRIGPSADSCRRV